MALGGVAACGELGPTSVDDELLPDKPVTVEVRIPWDDFASNLVVLGGYGAAREVGTGLVAHLFAGALEARTIVRFSSYPGSASVRDTTGTIVTDTRLQFPAGTVVAVLDTIASTNTGPVTLALGGLSQTWDPSTATWALEVDTIGDQRVWGEPGAGPVTPFATAIWDPAAGDSVTFRLDSAQVAFFGDSAQTQRAARIDVVSEGVRLKVNNIGLRLDTRPSARPDTTLILSVSAREFTFVYSPSADPPSDGLRVGGVPAWRSVLDVRFPVALNGPASLCTAVGCPLELSPDRLSYASLVLYSQSSAAAFQPSDTVGLDVRPVLERSALPKAPLGGSLLQNPLGRRVAPGIFEAAGQEVEIPLTAFAWGLLEGDTAGGFTIPRPLALLSTFEPASFSFASFFGPGTAQAPELKLIVTAGRAVGLP